MAMTIEFVVGDGLDVKCCPRIACDHCDEYVSNARYAHVLWDHPFEKIWFVHQGCSKAFDRARGKHSGHWEHLASFLYNLLSNVTYDSIKAEQLAAIHGLEDLEAEREERKVNRGSVTPEVRRFVMERDEYQCQHCRTAKNLVIDHVIPVVRGGTSHEDNLQVLCRGCNFRKADR